MRLDKYLADAGLGTRHHVKKLIRKGYVKVEEEVIEDESFNFDPKEKKVYVEDELIPYEEHFVLLMNKPKGYLCSTIDELYPSVLNLLDPSYRKRAVLVGRLDVDTTGLFLFTDDGKLANHLINPRFGLEKEYEVTLDHDLKAEDIEDLLKNGALMDEERVIPKKITVIASNKAQVVVGEGKYHEIKRLFKSKGYEVTDLKRLRIGDVTLPSDLPLGKYIKCTEEERQHFYILGKMPKEEE